MTSDVIAAGVIAWAVAAITSLTQRGSIIARILMFAGCIAVIAAAIAGLPDGIPAAVLPTVLAGQPVRFLLTPDALWLLGFGLAQHRSADCTSKASRRGGLAHSEAVRR